MALLAPGVAHARVAPVSWCGKDETAADRTPQTTLGNRVRFVYAVPADGADHFGDYASGIATDAAAIDQWWRAQDASRVPRFDLFAFPGCTSRFGNLDIGFVRLPRTGAQYKAADTFDALQSDLKDAFPADQKTVLYYDGPSHEQNICGQSPVANVWGGQYGIAFLFLQVSSGCNMLPLGGASSAEVAAHELLHNLGAVPQQAPHVCQDSHVCDAGSDILQATLNRASTLDVVTLDYQRDDYYGHSGSWWDVQDSAWLAHLPQHALTVSLAGPGSLLVRIGTTIVDCNDGCANVALDDGVSMQIAAVPKPGWKVGSWSGSCSGNGASCVVDNPTGDISASVTFVRASLTISVSVSGKGRVTSRPAGLSCTSVCRRTFTADSVALTAAPAPGWRFVRWEGGCNGRSCTIAESGPPVLARFVRK
jgi:hypothetical protein